VVRSIKLIVAALIFIGRIDVPLIADSANRIVGPVKYDGFPMFFRKEILAHEAHRHPYIERLGMIYMMKLRNRKFGNRAGACWRLIFIFTLMPWMRKYRLDIDENEVDITFFKFGKTKNNNFSGRMPLQTLVKLSKKAKEASSVSAVGVSKLLVSGRRKGGPDDENGNLEADVVALTQLNSSLAYENDALKKQLDELKSSLNMSFRGRNELTQEYESD